MERTPEDEIVAAYRAGHACVCVVCKYPLAGVPMSDQRTVTCPECGFVTQFRVRVDMVAYSGEQAVEDRKRLGRADRLVSLIAITLFLAVVVAMILIAVNVI